MAKAKRRKSTATKGKGRTLAKQASTAVVRHMRLMPPVAPESAKHDRHIRLVRALSVITAALVAVAVSMVVGTLHLAAVPSESDILTGIAGNGTDGTTLESLRKRGDCHAGTVLNVVAHEDDDILFLNPHLAASIATKKCIRTVYITAGDDGQTTRYWRSRELGSEAAYAYMYHANDSWSTVEATIHGHPVEVAYLDGHPTISLLFLHLPDGSPSGTGFANDNGETLNKLRMGSIHQIHSLDGKTSYTSAQLTFALKRIMVIDIATEVNTQAYFAKVTPDDHSDHQAVGYFTDRAQAAYMNIHSFTMYYGYQLNGFPANLSAEQIAYKRAVFAIYESYDPEICQGFSLCANEYSYENYLERQYTTTVALPRY